MIRISTIVFLALAAVCTGALSADDDGDNGKHKGWYKHPDKAVKEWEKDRREAEREWLKDRREAEKEREKDRRELAREQERRYRDGYDVWRDDVPPISSRSRYRAYDEYPAPLYETESYRRPLGAYDYGDREFEQRADRYEFYDRTSPRYFHDEAYYDPPTYRRESYYRAPAYRYDDYSDYRDGRRAYDDRFYRSPADSPRYPDRGIRTGARIGSAIGELIGGPEGAAIGGSIGADIGAEIEADR